MTPVKASTPSQTCFASRVSGMCEASATMTAKGEEKRKPDQRMQHRGRDDHQQRASHLGARIEALQQPVPARQILGLHGMGEGVEEMGRGS